MIPLRTGVRGPLRSSEVVHHRSNIQAIEITPTLERRDKCRWPPMALRRFVNLFNFQFGGTRIARSAAGRSHERAKLRSQRSASSSQPETGDLGLRRLEPGVEASTVRSSSSPRSSSPRLAAATTNVPPGRSHAEATSPLRAWQRRIVRSRVTTCGHTRTARRSIASSRKAPEARRQSAHWKRRRMPVAQKWVKQRLAGLLAPSFAGMAMWLATRHAQRRRAAWRSVGQEMKNAPA